MEDAMDVANRSEQAIINNEESGYVSDPLEDEDKEEIIVVTTPGTASRPKKRERYSSNTPQPATVSTSSTSRAHLKMNEEMKALRFHHHKTAFDVDIDSLMEHPWRQPHTDQSDYFNYGFSEDAWIVYCERQLKIRNEMGLGPVRLESASEHG